MTSTEPAPEPDTTVSTPDEEPTDETHEDSGESYDVGDEQEEPVPESD